MTLVDWCVVVFYLACVIAIGRYFARRQQNTGDYFLGGGRMPWLAVAFSMMASLASTVGYLGTPGEVIKNGVGMFVSSLAIPLSLPILLLVILPFYKRAYQREGVTTCFELLRQRYGASTHLLGVVIWAYMQTAFLGLVLLLASRLVSDMTDIPDIVVIIVIGLASVLYTSAGGMKSVVWTDVMQFAMLFLGAVVTVGVVAAKTGTGVATWWHEVSGQTHELPPLFSLDLATRHTVFGTLLFGFVVQVAYASSEQVVVQRFGATRRVVAMMLTNYGVGVLFSVLQFAVGASLLVFYLRTPGTLPEGIALPTDPAFADQAFPHFIVHYMPIGMTGIVIAALLGAAQSTVDSGVNSMAAVISKDVLPFFGRDNSAGDELQTARWSTKLVGVGVIVMALVAENVPASNNIIDIAQKVVHLGLGPLGALFLVTMLTKRVGTVAANIALLSGFCVAIFFAFHEALLSKTVLSPLLIIPVSFIVTLVLMIIPVSFIVTLVLTPSLGWVYRAQPVNGKRD